MPNLIELDGSNLSIIIQGALSSIAETSNVVNSYKSYLPKAEIIISTWNEYADLATNYDKLVISEDPGSLDFSKFGGRAQHNFNRQIISTKNGVKDSSRSFSLKVRSDLAAVNDNLIKSYNNVLKDSNELNAEFFSDKPLLAISNESSKKPSLFPAYLHFCDWFILGTTDEIKKLFSCSIATFEELIYRNDESTPIIYQQLKVPEIKWSVETYMWTNYLKNYYKFEMNNEFDDSDLIKEIHNKTISNNLIILDQKRAGLTVFKKMYSNRAFFKYSFEYSYDDWLLASSRINTSFIRKLQLVLKVSFIDSIKKLYTTYVKLKIKLKLLLNLN